jgi:hypothetical protein
MLLLYCDRPSFTPIQNKWHNYGFVYFNLYIPREQTGRQKLAQLLVGMNYIPKGGHLAGYFTP